MAYLDTRRGPSFGSMAAVVAIHGAVGAALILCLSVAGVIDKDEVLIGINIKPTETPLPPEPPTPQPETRQSPDRKVVAPKPPIAFPRPTPGVDTTPFELPPLPPLPPVGESIGKAVPTPAPSFTAVGAKPRNDPNRWVTTEDYRGNWIRRELTGRARFRLDILADGRVAGCTITASSGHPELDAATCALVSKRAMFQPARGSEGEPVAGSYTSAIDWQLPE